MPVKKPNIFEVSGKEPPKPKKLTLFQYIKENPNAEYPIYSRIETVWFPGKWDNYSLECEHFRVSISPSHTLYELLEGGIVRILTDANAALLIELSDSSGVIGIRESNFYGVYKTVGNAGYRFEATNGAN
jgi:hypothetical protein